MPNNDKFAWFALEPPANQRRAYKDVANRLNAYVYYLSASHQNWYEPNLVAYQEFLLNVCKLAPTSVDAHIRTVRNRYRGLLDDGTLRKKLEQIFQENWDLATANIEVEARLKQISETISSSEALLDAPRPEVEYRRFRFEHIRALLVRPNPNSPVGRRDVAIFSLMLTTGLRTNEICALQVEDLLWEKTTEPALHVPPGPGCTERVIPYGGLIWGLNCVSGWLSDSFDRKTYWYRKISMDSGPVFRGFYRGGKFPRPNGLSPRSLDYVFKAYPIEFEGELTTIRPMELRRTYARLLFELGHELDDIKRRLGVVDGNTVMDYIGGSDADLGLPTDRDVLEEHTWLWT